MKAMPEDFSIRYWWREGSVPPPHHYEYAICLGPGTTGSITFYPDYPMDKPPVWTETFNVDNESRQELYALINEKELLHRRWTEIKDPPVGGSLEWLEIVAQGKHIIVPSAINESQIVADIYRLIRGLVPTRIWTKLMRQRDRYQQGYFRNAGRNQNEL